ncbi:MAG: hypothetical protein NC936_04375, partial [Candidatus Omnitrophica bacterium]|nr:hypothetical protein [Candidatus Omnitrophota bacterium]
ERNLVFNARLALNRMVREIRQAKNITAQPNSTWFNFTDINNQTINFYQAGNYLYRNSDELTSLLDPSEGLIFSYFDATGNATNNTTLMRQVNIRLNLKSDEQAVNVESLVRFRNIN